MGYITKNWRESINLSQKFLDKIKPQTSLKNRINDAEKKMECQILRLEQVHNKLKQNHDHVFKKIVEAILFSSSEPVKLTELSKITGRDEDEVLNAVNMLIEEYSSRDTSIEVIKVGDGYLMRIKPRYADYVEKFTVREFDRGTLRTLAVIAVKQPITLAKVAKFRGNKCYDHVRKLIDRKLVKAEKKGRSTILTTTEEFASYFGLESSEPEKIKEALKKYFEDEE